MVSLFKSAPTVSQALLLPDHLFFVRAFPVATPSTAAEVAEQVELLLESHSPFPVTQLYFGHFWVPGSERVLVWASYRKRFPADQTAEWDAAEWVAPSFTAVLSSIPTPQAAGVLPGELGYTVVRHDADGRVPASVETVFWPAELPEAERLVRLAAVRDALTAEGWSVTLIETPPTAMVGAADEEVEFTVAGVTRRVPRAELAPLDIRDKADLAARVAARRRDRFAWRALIICLALVGLAALTELALIGGGLLQQARTTQSTAQAPTVQRIQEADSLARRIEDLSAKRLLPFEMLELLNRRRPATIQFTRSVTDGLYGMSVTARTGATSDVNLYQGALREMPELATVEVRNLRTTGAEATFDLVVTFKPEALPVPTAAPAPLPVE